MQVKRFFEDRLRQYGDSPQSLDWSEYGQRKRFEILSEVGTLSEGSVLDLGCGLGHLCEYLAQRFTGVEYTGYDFSDLFVSRAKMNYAGARFEVRDVLKEDIPERFDFVLSSGIHNLETGSNDDDMVHLLGKAWASARVGVAFSMLSTQADRKEEGRHYYDPVRMLAEAMRLTRYTVLRHDYMPHDFALYLYRELRRRGEGVTSQPHPGQPDADHRRQTAR